MSTIEELQEALDAASAKRTAARRALADAKRDVAEAEEDELVANRALTRALIEQQDKP